MGYHRRSRQNQQGQTLRQCFETTPEEKALGLNRGSQVIFDPVVRVRALPIGGATSPDGLEMTFVEATFDKLVGDALFFIGTPGKKYGSRRFIFSVRKGEVRFTPK